MLRNTVGVQRYLYVQGRLSQLRWTKCILVLTTHPSSMCRGSRHLTLGPVYLDRPRQVFTEVLKGIWSVAFEVLSHLLPPSVYLRYPMVPNITQNVYCSCLNSILRLLSACWMLWTRHICKTGTQSLRPLPTSMSLHWLPFLSANSTSLGIQWSFCLKY